MTCDELKSVLAGGAVVNCKNVREKHDVIVALHDMGFSCSQNMMQSTNMGYPFVQVHPNNSVDAVLASYVMDHELEIIPADAVLGAEKTQYVFADVASLLV